MAANSPVTKVQDNTTKKEALSKMYEDSRNAFPDVRKTALELTAQTARCNLPRVACAWQVQAISCTELNDMLSASESIVLVDVRSPDEQNVSMLPGHVVRQTDFDRHLQDYSDSKVVTYWYACNCTAACTL